MRGARGFTLLELVVAMAVFGLVSVALYGVLVLGARSASSGERVSEQARRFRIATSLMGRQIAATDALYLPRQDEEGLGDEDDSSEPEPFFYGDADEVEFVTTAPQRPDASGLAIVRYWVEEGELKMSEKPVYLAYGTDEGLDDEEAIDETMETTLLYDVESVTFSYQREADADEFLEVWDAAEEDLLPACVRVEIAPATVDGPALYHEMPLMVATFNQVVDAEDFKGRRGLRDRGDDDDDGTPPTTQPAGGNDNDNDNDNDEEDDEDDEDDEELDEE
ncbi:MAG TPA: prepilin-type N-terminal cleavage/methylation domain-containing protein [Candidatus Limnocylindrales bacterium]|nr:prepilin-type N-terminal cleavage/methylation domain-containing protein [Candidatus Limnocylindrales bacterium]